MDRLGVHAFLASSLLFLAPACAPEGKDLNQADDTKKGAPRDAVGDAPAEPAAASAEPTDAPNVPLCAASTRFSLPDAAWMAWFSERSYRDYEEVAPALTKAGFGNLDDADLWLAEAAKVSQARKDGAPDLPAIEIGASQTPHLDRKLDFFSAGAMEDGQFVHQSTQVAWAQHRTLPIAVIAFRGTEADEMTDVVTDMTTSKLESNVTRLPGRLHRGFFEAVESVAPFLFARIRDLPPSSRIYVTGHSLGGALATIFTAQLLRDHGGAHGVSLYTFGAPRVGDATFASAFEASITSANASASRLHYEKDPVVRVPFLDYEHAGLPVFLGPDRFTLDSPEKLVIPRMADHEMGNYRNAVHRALSQQPAYPMNALGRAADRTLDSVSTCTR